MNQRPGGAWLGETPADPEVPTTDESAPLPSRGLIVRAGVWSIADRFSNDLLRLLSNVVLARLLHDSDGPRLFGTMLILNLVLAALEMISDVGIQHSIIQNRRGDDPAFYNTAWTIQVIRGAGLWVGAVLLAWPIAAYYALPELTRYLPIVAFVTILNGFASTSLHGLVRRMELRRFALISVSGQALTTTGVIIWAWYAPSIWALIAGNLLGGLFRTLLSHVFGRVHRNRFAWNADCRRELFRFGRWIMVSSLVFFLAQRIDAIMAPKFVELELAGLFSLAFAIAWIPVQIAGTLNGKVLMPAISMVARRSRAELSARLREARGRILPGALVATLAVPLAGPTFFLLLYEEVYWDAAWIVELMSICAWLTILPLTADRALLAVGDTFSLALANTLRLVSGAIACVLGFHWFGFAGFILGPAAGAIAANSVVQFRLRRHEIHVARQDFGFTLAFLALAGVGCFGPRWLGAPALHERVSVTGLCVTAAVFLVAGAWAARALFGKRTQSHA